MLYHNVFLRVHYSLSFSSFKEKKCFSTFFVFVLFFFFFSFKDQFYCRNRLSLLPAPLHLSMLFFSPFFFFPFSYSIVTPLIV